MAECSHMTFRHEVVRKSIHMAFLAIPAGYCILLKKTILAITGSLLLFAVFVETSRFLWPAFSRLFYRLFSRLLRPWEFTTLTGSTYLLSGLFFSILFFDKWIAIASILFLCISDALSGIVGRRWGRIKINDRKTMEGSLVFVVTAALIVWILPGIGFYVGASGVLSGFLIDLGIRHVNDNLSVPLGTGFIMQLVSWAV